MVMSDKKREKTALGGTRRYQTGPARQVFKTGAFNHSATHPCDRYFAEKGNWRASASIEGCVSRVPTFVRRRWRYVPVWLIWPQVAKHWNEGK
jgi:hypothetical protein